MRRNPPQHRSRGVPPTLAAARLKLTMSGGHVSQLFSHFDQELTSLARLDLVKRLDDADRTRRLNEAEDALGIAGRLARGSPRPPAEEEGDRHFQRLGNALQPPCADAVHALLVFLHLLERHADTIGELSL